MSMANQPVLIFVRFWVNQKSVFKGLVSKDLNEVGCFPLLPRSGEFIWLLATRVIVNAPF